jgi:DNA invertase Pin-like site-specific DNA recombinase
VADYADAAVSGATLMRVGIQSLLRDAAEKRFDVVLAESLDRFSRDLADTAVISKRLKFQAVKLVTISEGDISHLQVGFKGTMNALFLQDLADKTRRGLRGRVENGRSAGGVSYGYRVVRAPDGAPRGDRDWSTKTTAIQHARRCEASSNGSSFRLATNS